MKKLVTPPVIVGRNDVWGHAVEEGASVGVHGEGGV